METDWPDRPLTASAPAERRGNVRQDRLDDVGVIVDAERVRHGEQQRIRLRDRLVALQLLDQPIRLGLTENDMPYTGKITGIDPKIDPSTRLVSVRAEIANPGGKLNPGQFVRVRVALPTEDGVIVIPQTALVASLYGDFVYRIKTTPAEGGDEAKPAVTVEQVFVQAGRRSDGTVEIVDGLSAGDEVVNAGQNRLSNGASVTINNEVQPVLEKDDAQ